MELIIALIGHIHTFSCSICLNNRRFSVEQKYLNNFRSIYMDYRWIRIFCSWHTFCQWINCLSLIFFFFFFSILNITHAIHKSQCFLRSQLIPRFFSPPKKKKKKTITTTYSEFLIIPYFSPNILAISHYNLSDILPKDSNKTFCNVYKKLATYSCRIQ